MKAEVIELSDLIEAGAAFESRGVSTIKATRDGKPIGINIPIRSKGVAAFQEKLSAKAPVPPSKIETVDGKPQRVPDFNDERYVDEYNKFSQHLIWQVVAFALDGFDNLDLEARIDLLKNNGLSAHQLDQLFDDIQSLTKFAEGERDFLFGS